MGLSEYQYCTSMYIYIYMYVDTDPCVIPYTSNIPQIYVKMLSVFV